MSPGLSRVWRTPIPHPLLSSAALAVSPVNARIAVAGTSVAAEAENGAGHSVGSLTLIDSRSGNILHQFHDEWQVHQAIFSPDGRFIAISEVRFLHKSEPGEKRVRVVDAEVLVERCRYQEVLKTTPERLIFSPDGTWIAVVMYMNFDPLRSVSTFDAVSGTKRWQRDLDQFADADIAVSPDSASVAVALGDAPGGGGIAVLDGKTGADRRMIACPAPVNKVIFSPDGRRLVASCYDGTVQVFDANTGAAAWSSEQVALAPGSWALTAIAVSADSHFVAAVFSHSAITGTRHTVGVYDLLTGTPKLQVDDLPDVFGGYPAIVRYSPTLRHIVVMCPPGSRPESTAPPYLAVVDAATGRQTGMTGRTVDMGDVFDLAADGSIVVSSGLAIELYDIGLETSRYEVEETIRAIEMSPGGTPLVAVTDTGSEITVFVASNGTQLTRMPYPGPVTATVFADGGQSFAVGGEDGVRFFSVLVGRKWAVDTIGSVQALAAVGLAGDWIATAAARTLRLLSSSDGHERWATPASLPNMITRVAASSNGAWIAAGCLDRTTRIFDATTGTQNGEPVKGDGKVRELAFQPGRPLLASANADGNIVLIDTETATELGRIQRPFGCTHLAFSGMLLAAAWDDNTISTYDVTNPKPTDPPPRLWESPPLPAPVSRLVANPTDGTIAISVTGGTSVIVREPGTGQERIRIPHHHQVRDIAISADGSLLATACDDNVVRVWPTASRPD